MFLLIIISVISLIIGICWVVHDFESIRAAVLMILSALCVIGFVFGALKFQLSSETLTGYIYRRSDSFGHASYDIRYSLNAGEDNQPLLCVNSGSNIDNKLKTLVGTESKVEIYIPSNGLFLANNPYECNSQAQLIKVETIEENK